MKHSLVVLFLVLAFSASVYAGNVPRSFHGDPLVAGFSDTSRPGLLQAGIRWGELRIQGHDAGNVRVEPLIEVEAEIAARMTDDEIRERVAVSLVERGNVIEVVTNSTLQGFYSVDLAIWVPRDTSLGLEVRDGGNIQVDDVGGEVEISNRNGSVDLSGLGGAAVVYARNGSIRASFSSIPKDLPLSFSTLNGSVDVTFPETPSADVRIRYNRGGVESDFPIVSSTGNAAADTTGLDGRVTRLLEGRIAAGGPRYYFHTANGTVYLRQAGL